MQSSWLVVPALNLVPQNCQSLSYVALVSYLISLGLSFFIYIIGKNALILPASHVTIRLK